MAALAPAHPRGDHPPTINGRVRPALALRRNVVEFAESMWRQHGDVVRMVIGPRGLDREVWWLHHPDAAARVLSATSWQAYAKRDQVYDEIAHWLGPGLLTVEGEDWTRQKRLLQPVFTKTAVDGYADLMVEEIDNIMVAWDVADHPVVDLAAQMQRLTLRVVVRSLFGDTADDAEPNIRRSFPTLSDTIMRRGLAPVRLPVDIRTRRVRRGRSAHEDLVTVCDTIIAARRKRPQDGTNDLLVACSPHATATSGSPTTRSEPRCSSSFSPGARPRRRPSPSPCTCSVATRRCRTA